MADEISKEFEQVSSEFKEFSQKMKDPLVVGALLNKLSEERQSSNLLLKEINAKLDKLLSFESRLAKLEEKVAAPQVAQHALTGPAQVIAHNKVLLAEVDEAIVALVKQNGACCAEDVQKNFQYKGKNAASARLNKLVGQGLLVKRQVGKKVFFELAPSS